MSTIALRVKGRLEAGAEHDEIYDERYFRRQDAEMRASAVGIADSLIELYEPESVVDVGCGSGAVLAAFVARGVAGRGLEYADAAIVACRRKGLTVERFDLEGLVTHYENRADLVVSTEVAEHLPESVADRYVTLLCSLSDVVVMTAATPGQGGTDHVNEQPNEYWIAKFSGRGFTYQHQVTRRLREDWSRRGVEWRRAKNVMAFTRRQEAGQHR